ncbi:LacI family DNA-binding transcriptional regulator [Streptosporangium sp. NBC_01756]|uniref:LacI family DNA-binding transcriptional regulator n=1 Tax=Streptosporangium sp. NBC_01756 TaxID=2975950 RepID=UPI002DD7EB65|nr:LacI family DNA-binding transcriptional regulator [Streptosporangium sp. NBC_01756]WSC90106.1 LacI family transcriptional regulator [Streptosporangium sp. NBC_01756]
MREARRTTLKDIAVSLGVSVNTVSRALADKDNVGVETRTRVKEEAERLGYVPNSTARSLVLGSATTLGMVITNPSNPFYAQLISAMEQHCRKHGYSLLLMATEENLANERRAAEELLRRGVDGVLVVAVQEGAEHWRRFRSAGVPLVLINRDVPELNTDLVGVDHVRGGYEAARHAIAQGARKIYFLEEDLRVSSVADRVEGYRRAMAESGLSMEPDSVIKVPTRRLEQSAMPWDPSEAYRLAREVLRTEQRPLAFVAGNDYFALGVYRVAEEAGLKIPKDVLVVGYGGHPFAPYVIPTMTTVELPATEIGVSAVDHMLQRLRRPAAGGAPEKILLPPRLVVRASSGGNGT